MSFFRKKKGSQRAPVTRIAELQRAPATRIAELQRAPATQHRGREILLNDRMSFFRKVAVRDTERTRLQVERQDVVLPKMEKNEKKDDFLLDRILAV
mgnify:CR=1 FL=1